MKTVVCGLGGCIPPNVVSNEEILGENLRLSDWIRRMTGIEQRRMVSGGLSTRDLAIRAGQRALASAGYPSIDAVVIATASPDRLCPALAPEVATALELGNPAAFDMNAACSGFVYGLATVNGLIASGSARSVLFIGAEAFSTFVNPNDRNTRPIFGDGACAVVLRAGEDGEDGALGPFDLGSDGSLPDALCIPAGGARQRARSGLGHTSEPEKDWFLYMDGQAIYQHAIARMTESARRVLGRAGWSSESLDWFAGHQANKRILSTLGYELGLPDEKVAVNIGHLGNTVSASVGLLLSEFAHDKKITQGQRILISAFGAGLSWGSTLLTWPQLNVQGIDWDTPPLHRNSLV